VDHSLHYTPIELANRLVAQAVSENPRTVADFCVGDGRLLSAARTRWSTALLHGNDIDEKAGVKLRSTLRLAKVTHYDFLSEECLYALDGRKFDVILLNPPFSEAGKKKWMPCGVHSGVGCSLSMAFILTSLNFIAVDGEVLAIMPASTLASEIDEHARFILRSMFDISVLTGPAPGLFPNISASVYTLRIRHLGTPQSLTPEPWGAIDQSFKGDLIRGNISVPKARRVVASGNEGWIHTTSLRDGKIMVRYSHMQPAASKPKVAPPNSVLIPRVGRFRPDQIVVTGSRSNEYISDCLFAIPCPSPAAARRLQKKITDNADGLRELYVGTGAPYITAERLSRFLSPLRKLND